MKVNKFDLQREPKMLNLNQDKFSLSLKWTTLLGARFLFLEKGCLRG